MKSFYRDRKPTKKSCLANALVAFAIGAVMVLCIFATESITPQRTKSFIVGAGIMAAVGLYWLYRLYKFDDQDFNDPLHLNH